MALCAQELSPPLCMENIYTTRRRKAPLLPRFGVFMGWRLLFSAGREYSSGTAKVRCQIRSFLFTAIMTSHQLFLAEIQTSISSTLPDIFGLKVTNVINGTYRTVLHIFRVYSTTFSKVRYRAAESESESESESAGVGSFDRSRSRSRSR